MRRLCIWDTVVAITDFLKIRTSTNISPLITFMSEFLSLKAWFSWGEKKATALELEVVELGLNPVSATH